MGLTSLWGFGGSWVFCRVGFESLNGMSSMRESSALMVAAKSNKGLLNGFSWNQFDLEGLCVLTRASAMIKFIFLKKQNVSLLCTYLYGTCMKTMWLIFGLPKSYLGLEFCTITQVVLMNEFKIGKTYKFVAGSKNIDLMNNLIKSKIT